jgi:hypothetical protein
MSTSPTPESTPASTEKPPPVHQEVPALTLYRDGLANLNGEATRALPAHGQALMLLPPTTSRRQWLLLPADGELAGDIRLIGRPDRGNLRFRSSHLAVSLFAALPAAQGSLRLQLEPAAPGWRLVAQ